jgi:8-oxo-dGTP diphosphatase
VEEGAARELFEETGLQHIELNQFHTFSQVDRDPRGRTVSVAFIGIVQMEDVVLRAGDDAARVQWFPITCIPALAFDHAEMLERAIIKLKQQGTIQVEA